VIDIPGGLPEQVREIDTIGHEAAVSCKEPVWIMAGKR
jgi:hypothetical protein